MTRFVEPGRVGGFLRAPPSKSVTQRAVACALLAEGESILLDPGRSADCLAALRVAAALGASVEDRGVDGIAIRGIGFRAALGAEGAAKRRDSGSEPAGLGPAGSAFPTGGAVPEPLRLDCGESGLCLRMFSPIAALFPGESLLEASGSLRKRPVDMVAAPVRALGALCETNGGFPPVRVRGPLRVGRISVDGSESSQSLTGLLIALPLAAPPPVRPADGSYSALEAGELPSGGYVELTLETMRDFGVEARMEASGAGFRFLVPAGQAYRARSFRVEGDWSGAAFPLVAAAVAGLPEGIALGGLRADSLQPDRAVLEALRAAGAIVGPAAVRAGGAVGAPGAAAAPVEGAAGVRVRPGPLRGFTFDARRRPDLFPPLAVLAAAAQGESRIAGIGRLRSKESDRAESVAELLRALGVGVGLEGDEMVIAGAGPGGLRGGRVDSRGDHRIAMAAAIAALAASGPVEILGAECVSKSWPEFFEALDTVRAP